jgi:hypothetical protein
MAYKIDIDIDKLKELYFKEKKTLDYLSKNIFYVSRQTLYNRLKEFNIKKKDMIDISEVIRLYEVEKKSLHKIANQLNCSHTKIYVILKAKNIKLRGRWEK